MLSCSGNNFPIHHDANLPGNDVLSALTGHLYVHSSAIAFIGGRHVNIPPSSTEVAYLGFLLLDGTVELVNADSGFFKVLLRDGGVAVDSGDEAIGDGAGSGSKVVVTAKMATL